MRRKLLAKIQLGVLYTVGIGSVGVNAYVLYLQRSGQLEKVDIRPSPTDLAFQMRLQQTSEEQMRQKLASRGYNIDHLDNSKPPPADR